MQSETETQVKSLALASRHNASRVLARLLNNAIKVVPGTPSNERPSRREKESDSGSNERKVTSSTPSRHEGDRIKEPQSQKPQDARQLQRITEVAESE